jgi:GNAT superfamily N-acetyltransferase
VTDVEIHPRSQLDLGRCEEMARTVHEQDRYPHYLPSTLLSFLAEPDALASWVAEREREIVGHVALHPTSSSAVMALAEEATGEPAARLAVVARLMVSPAARGLGVGRRLLETAAAEAQRLGRRPILDVVTDHQAAIELYERCGWTRVGVVTVSLGGPASLDEFVYVSPAGGD